MLIRESFDVKFDVLGLVQKVYSSLNNNKVLNVQLFFSFGIRNTVFKISIAEENIFIAYNFRLELHL